MIKKIFNVIKIMCFGVIPAIMGGAIALDIVSCTTNIINITTNSVTGWGAIIAFILALMEIVLAFIFLYELGKIQINAYNWTAYKRVQAENTIDGSSKENETSDEAADA